MKNTDTDNKTAKVQMVKWRKWLKANGTNEMVWPFNLWEARTVPYFSSHENLIKDAPFSHYEIQTTREWKSPDGESRFFEVVTDAKDCDESPLACGPVVFSIYGRLKTGTVEHLCDRKSLSDAIETLTNIGIAVNP